MNSRFDDAPHALTNGQLFVNAMILAGLAAALGLGLSDSNPAAVEAANAGAAAMSTRKVERVVSDSWITPQASESSSKARWQRDDVSR